MTISDKKNRTGLRLWAVAIIAVLGFICEPFPGKGESFSSGEELKSRHMFVYDSLFTDKVKITGTVTSAEKGEPVPYANVFLVNTMIGAVTDEKGNFEIRNVPLGTFELMVSYVGFIAQKRTLRIEEVKDIQVNLILQPDQQNLAEVEVKSRKDKEWEKQFNRFEKQLLGRTSNASQCRILNPWVVNFTPGEKSAKFSAMASAPLEIENKALGYKLYFYLKRFESEGLTGLFVGETKFEALKASSPKEQARWERNRQEAYEGSIRHFFKSLIHNTWEQEGFLVYSVVRERASSVRNMHTFLYNEVGRSLDGIKPKEILFPGRMPFERKLRFPGKIEIIYTRENTTRSPYKDVPHPVSRIKMVEPIIDLTTDGRVYNPTSFEITGHLVTEGVADMLPFEYSPQQSADGKPLENLTAGGQNQLESIPGRFEKAADWRKQQKAYLHTDKPFYVGGETIWLSAYVVESSLHTLYPGSQVLYVDLFSPGQILVQQLKLPLNAGRASGAIALPDSLPAGNYRLLAYTQFMRNFDAAFLFNRIIPVFDIKNKSYSSAATASHGQIDLQFFPEGGHLVSGITSKLAFKALRPDGKGAHVKGRILDNKGNQLMSFESNALGMGKFNFKPESGKTYQAECTVDEATLTFPLPAAQPEGFVMSVQEMNAGKIQLKLLSSRSFEQDNFLVVAQTRGIIQHTARGAFKNGVSFMEIPSFNLPNGICQLTLFSSQGTAVCERLVFINNISQQPKLQVKPGELTYTSREKASLSVRVTNQDGEPVRTTFSVAVTDAGQVVKESTAENIRTYMLLNSDLKGYIESPGLYFKDRSDSTKEALDLLMLTQGWRRFSWNDILSGKSKPIEFPLEKGIQITGKIVSKDKKARPIPQCKITVVSMDSVRLPLISAYSDPEGRFSLEGVPLVAGTKIAFQLSSTKGKTVHARVILDDQQPLLADLPQMLTGQEIIVPEAYLAKASQRKQIDSVYSFNRGEDKVLGEVVVKAKRLPNTNPETSGITRLHSSADAVIIVDDKFPIFNDIYQMISGRVAGVNVAGTSITIRGVSSFNSGTQPLFIVDGIPISSDPNDTLTAGNDPIGFVNPRDVERIEFLKNPATTGMYGVRGANGVIAIYTRQGASAAAVPDQPQLETYTGPGFTPVREFYTPRYDLPSDEHIKPDKRATLLWIPDLRTDENGEADVTFYLSDDSRSFQLVLEGMTVSGQPVNYMQVFAK